MDRFSGLMDLFGMDIDWWRIANMQTIDLLAQVDFEPDPVLEYDIWNSLRVDISKVEPKSHQPF